MSQVEPENKWEFLHGELMDDYKQLLGLLELQNIALNAQEENVDILLSALKLISTQSMTASTMVDVAHRAVATYNARYRKEDV